VESREVVAVVKQFALVAVLGLFADYLHHVTITISVDPDHHHCLNRSNIDHLVAFVVIRYYITNRH
jgi:hypothetical protein